MTTFDELSQLHAQKLRKWLISMMMLFLFAIVQFNVSYIWDPRCVQYGQGENVGCIGVLGESLLPTFMVGTALFFWHGLEFFQKRKPSNRILAFMNNYRVFGICAVALLTLHAMRVSGQFTEIQPCGGVFSIISQSCYVTSPLLKLPGLIFSALIVILCIAKLIATISSNLEVKS
ncbi:hypothetical protein [Parasphingorhabdus sp.]|uniref:hypothetical protein n=1 Tax=Parasphingorhabdus sp. TaxID=2709688 RepID=UPI00326341DB